MSPSARTLPNSSVSADSVTNATRCNMLLTLAYSDLFDYPLTADELYRFWAGSAVSRPAFDQMLEQLVPDRIMRIGEFHCLPGREAIVDCRAERSTRAAARWHLAERFARRLARVPFLRMVAVCGSQAVDNPGTDGDIDLFLITAPERLWLVQAATMVLRRITPGADFCPNYLLTEASLGVTPHNLYTAREITQAVPLWGARTYQQFLDANRWADRFLPHRPASGRRTRLGPDPTGRFRNVCERLLGGRLGTLLDRAVHQTLILYYTVRLRGRGWSRSDVARAYRRDRQVVITGGYLGAVATRFLERSRTALAAEAPPPNTTIEQVVAASFLGPDTNSSAPTADPLYARLFRTRYGDARG